VRGELEEFPVERRRPFWLIGERRVRWVHASYPAVRDLLTNLVYAGAFAFGRTREEKHLGADGRVRRVALPLSTSAA
jgi:hypothetical protein